MNEILTVRPRLRLQALQWDGEEVEGFRRIAVGLDELGSQDYNLVATLLDEGGLPKESFAVPGDWIIIGSRGSWVCLQHEFTTTYEVVAEEKPHEPHQDDHLPAAAGVGR